MRETAEFKNTQKKEHKGKKSKHNLLAYSLMAPATALSIFASACQEQETKVSQHLTQSAVTRHIETTIPTQELPSEIKSAGVDVKTDETITQNVSSKGRTIDQDSQVIIETALKFPLPERITAVLTSSYEHDRAKPEEGLIIVGRERIKTETIEFETAHETAHILDPKNNEEYLLRFYTPQQVKELQELREDILNDEIWGRDYPSVAKIINGKQGANLIPDSNQTGRQIAAGSDIDANGIWIGGSNPFESDLRHSYLNLESAKSSQDEYGSFEEFAEKNRELINNFFDSSPLSKYAREDFYHHLNSRLFRTENVVWAAQTDNRAYLTGRYEDDFKDTLKRITNMILFEKYETGKLEDFISNLPSSKQDFLKQAFEFKKELSDGEKFAHVLAATVHTNSEGRGRDYLMKVALFNTVNNIVSKN